MFRGRLFVPVSVAVLFLAGCGGSSPTSPGGGGSSGSGSISTSPSSASFEALEDTATFTATVRDGNGSVVSGAQISWSSTNASVASVAGGKAVAQKNGTSKIIAMSSGLADTATVTVDQKADSVSVAPRADTLTAGDTVRLSASAFDANRHPIESASFAWISGDTTIASVDSAGVVHAKASGVVTITASLDAASAGANVNVQSAGPGGPPTIAAFSPLPLPEGGQATITGTGFDPNATGNTVLVDGVQAQVTSASTTSLTIDVPLYDCLPARSVPVQVTTTNGSGSSSAPLQPDETPVSLAAGHIELLQNPGQFCFQFAASASSESYLLGVQSISSVASSLTPVQISAEAADGQGAALTSPVRLDLTRSELTSSGGRKMTLSPPVRRWKAHQVSETALMDRETASWDRWLSARVSPSTGMQTLAISVGPSVLVGDTVSLRVPDISSGVDGCTTYHAIGAVVKAIGTRAILVADTANPGGGFTDVDYQKLSDRIDNDIFSTQVTYFGTPTDLDSNGHIVAVFSKELNAMDANTLGFVSLTNFAARSSCASSDEGEYFYGKVPDPNGDFGPAYALSDARLDMPFIMAHELTHVIQFGRRIVAGKAWMGSAIAEAQAMISIEVVGHAVTGRSSGQNYGYTVAFNANGTDEIDWYLSSFTDIGEYFGWSPSGKVNGAPEQCGWWQESASPCISRPLWYGLGWSFLRWVTDRERAAGYPGGEAGFHRDLVDGNQDGLATIETLAGEQLETLLADWAASLYVDDRVPTADPSLTTSSWNYADIFSNFPADAQLQPLQTPFSDWTATGDVRASSAGYLTIGGTGRPATAVRVRTQTDTTLPATMQIWIVRLQ